MENRGMKRGIVVCTTKVNCSMNYGKRARKVSQFRVQKLLNHSLSSSMSVDQRWLARIQSGPVHLPWALPRGHRVCLHPTWSHHEQVLSVRNSQHQLERDPYSGWDLSRIERLAHYILDDFTENIMVMCVLKGGYKFCADLVEFIKILGRNSNKYLETRVEFIRLKSYVVGGQNTTEEPTRILNPNSTCNVCAAAVLKLSARCRCASCLVNSGFRLWKQEAAAAKRNILWHSLTSGIYRRSGITGTADVVMTSPLLSLHSLVFLGGFWCKEGWRFWVVHPTWTYFSPELLWESTFNMYLFTTEEVTLGRRWLYFANLAPNIKNE